jgi:hypothetical protein
MTIATALCASLVCACLSAAAQKDASTVLACNLKAIRAVERPRYNQLVKRVREAMRERMEMSNGYAFILDGKTITSAEAGEWIDMERLCCPFLTLQISAVGKQTHWF